MGFFGKKKKEEEKTVLLLHVENGSVGAGLVRLGAGQPKLFGQKRATTPVAMSLSGKALAQEVERALADTLRHVGEVAARVRLHAPTAPMGAVDRAAVFLAAPWGRPNLSTGKPDFLDSMEHSVRGKVAQSFGDLPVSLYTAAGSAAFGTRALITEDPCLVCIITGEVSELLRMDQVGVVAHATFPSGSHALLRTLQTHGGLSPEEARSASRLPFATARMREPFSAASTEFGRQFKEAALDVMRPGEVARIVVVAEEPVGEWFARALESVNELGELFPDGGEVRAVRPSHATAHIAAHAEVPDLPLMLAALFADQLVVDSSL